jgi:hypothetical protein
MTRLSDQEDMVHSAKRSKLEKEERKREEKEKQQEKSASPNI